MKLMIDNIEATAATQVRKKMDAATIHAYVEDLKHGADFPAMTVFAEEGSERYILADGFHRLHAYVDAGIEEVEVDVLNGGMHLALVYALGANDVHGLRRSRADKRNAVEMALKDPEISQMSLREIGDICRVHHQTVANIRDAETLRKTGIENDPHNQEPEENVPENERLGRPDPTQEMVERDELRQAMSLLKALPYGGEDTKKLDLDKDDIADLEYVSAWCAHAVLVHRN